MTERIISFNGDLLTIDGAVQRLAQSFSPERVVLLVRPASEQSKGWVRDDAEKFARDLGDGLRLPVSQRESGAWVVGHTAFLGG